MLHLHEIRDAVNRATEGRWTIEARSPRSANAVPTVDASKVKAEVSRLQAERYLILSITPEPATELADRH